MDPMVGIYCLQRKPTRTAGDMAGVSDVPEKVIVKIVDTENWRRGCRDTNRLNKALIIAQDGSIRQHTVSGKAR